MALFEGPMKFNLENKHIRTSIKVFTFLMIFFYPIAFKYSSVYYDEQSFDWVAFIFTLFIGLFFNTGLLLTLSKIGLRWKKMTLFFLLFSLFASFFIFFLPYLSNSTELMAFIAACFCASYVMFIIILVIKYENAPA